MTDRQQCYTGSCRGQAPEEVQQHWNACPCNIKGCCQGHPSGRQKAVVNCLLDTVATEWAKLPTSAVTGRTLAKPSPTKLSHLQELNLISSSTQTRPKSCVVKSLAASCEAWLPCGSASPSSSSAVSLSSTFNIARCPSYKFLSYQRATRHQRIQPQVDLLILKLVRCWYTLRAACYANRARPCIQIDLSGTEQQSNQLHGADLRHTCPSL